MNEKKEAKKNGQNISFDGGEVINNVSLVEKVEEKKEEPKAEVTSSSEENSVNIVPEEPSVTSEIPAIPEIPITPETPAISVEPIPIPQINPEPVSDDSANFGIPAYNPFDSNQAPVENAVPETQGFGSSDYQNSFGINTDNQFESQSNFPTFGSFNNLSQEANEPQVPSGVRKAVDMVINESLELAKENSDLKEENKNLSIQNDELRRSLMDKESRINFLENQISSMKNSMAAAQSRILDVFGMGSQASNVVQFPNNRFNDSQNTNVVQFPNVNSNDLENTNQSFKQAS